MERMSFDRISEDADQNRRSRASSELDDLPPRKSGMIAAILTGVDDDPEFEHPPSFL